jgi:hypothetical protein
MKTTASKPAAFWIGLLSGFLAVLLVLGAASAASANWPQHPERAVAPSGAVALTTTRIAGPPPLALRWSAAEHWLYLFLPYVQK